MPTSYHLDHLQHLETEAIHIMREVAGEFERPALLFSGGKDSICLLRLAEKAFRPSDIPMPFLNVETGHEFPELIEFRDRRAKQLGAKLIIRTVDEGIAKGFVTPTPGQISRNQLQIPVLLNAIEASTQGPIRLDASRFADLIVLAVADRGPGVPESARRRVFDPFFSTKARGTGLGLAVSKQIIDEHQGRIRLLRRRGGGTRVVIELPA